MTAKKAARKPHECTRFSIVGELRSYKVIGKLRVSEHKLVWECNECHKSTDWIDAWKDPHKVKP